MSILLSSPEGWIISHPDLIKLTVPNSSNSSLEALKLNSKLFEINTPFKKHLKVKKRTKHDPSTASLTPSVVLSDLTLKIIDASDKLITLARNKDVFRPHSADYKSDNNKEAREVANAFYEVIKNFSVFPKVTHRNDSKEVDMDTILFDSAGGIQRFFVPRDSVMVSDNIENISGHLEGQLNKFSLVVMDPPWWNKYVRRRKRKQKEAGYSMMAQVDIRNIPVDQLCKDEALVVVWCTNSSAHQIQLINQFFPHWGVQYLATWYWLKVTKEGVPVCPFNADTQKQPFETIIIGRKHSEDWFKAAKKPPDDLSSDLKLVISVPSSIHSHKPPLIQILRPFVHESDLNSLNCCELFARYGLPGFTSFGNEVFKLMHELLYVKCEGD